MISKYCILLIDDDLGLRKASAELLSREGFEVVLAQNGSQGVQKAIEYIPDAIVCDTDMPGLSGYEVFHMLKQISSTLVVPFIFISERSSREDILAGINLGADAYLPKPFDLETLLNVIKSRIVKYERLTELTNEKFHALINTSLNGAIVLNGLMIEYTNKRFVDMLGYSNEELVGNNLINFVHKNYITDVVDSITKCQIGVTKSFEIAFNAITKDNEFTEIIMSGAIVNFNGTKKIVSNCAPLSNQFINKSVKKQGLTEKLTQREIEILTLICKGLTSSQIAEKLFLSERTIEGYRTKLFDKTGTNSAVSLALWAVKNKIVVL